jgi:hypothetical protein
MQGCSTLSDDADLIREEKIIVKVVTYGTVGLRTGR